MFDIRWEEKLWYTVILLDLLDYVDITRIQLIALLWLSLKP